jgi:hypothetical protein
VQDAELCHMFFYYCLSSSLIDSTTDKVLLELVIEGKV